MENQIQTFYKVTRATSVAKNPDGQKELIEREMVGKHTVKEIKDLLDDNETFVSVEYEDKSLSFDLNTFKELRKQDLI